MNLSTENITKAKKYELTEPRLERQKQIVQHIIDFFYEKRISYPAAIAIVNELEIEVLKQKDKLNYNYCETAPQYGTHKD